MSDVGNLFYFCDFYNFVYHGWIVIKAEFFEAIVVILCFILDGIKCFMIERVMVTSIVANPDVVSFFG